MEFLETVVKRIRTWVSRRCRPTYEPDRWNRNDRVRTTCNCYSYATDSCNKTFQHPGQASGTPLRGEEKFGCADYDKLARDDGLVRVDCDGGCGCAPKCCHKVALVLHPGHDYHWYRQDRDGTWSHKNGWSPATNLDQKGKAITDPRTAARGPYTVFCGCYCVCSSKFAGKGEMRKFDP